MNVCNVILDLSDLYLVQFHYENKRKNRNNLFQYIVFYTAFLTSNLMQSNYEQQLYTLLWLQCCCDNKPGLPSYVLLFKYSFFSSFRTIFFSLKESQQLC